MIRRSLHSPAALASAGICPLPPQGQQGASEGIFMGRTLVWSTPLFSSAPACLMPSTVRRVPLVTLLSHYPLHYFYSPGSGWSQTQVHDLSQQQALLSFALHEPELQPTQLPCHWAWEPYSLCTQHRWFPPRIKYLASQLIPLQTNNSVADH